MLNEDILEVLMFLLENGMMDEAEPDEAALIASLSEAGFQQAEINRAFDWLDTLNHMFEQEPQETARPANGFRLYTQDEYQRLGRDGVSFLMELEQKEVLDSVTRELIIDRIQALGMEQVDLDDVKWVTLFVLMNMHGRSYTNNELLESIIFEGDDTPLH